MVFKLPRLQSTMPIAAPTTGWPTLSFLRWFNIDFAGAIERQEAAQAATDARQDAIDADLVLINVAQDALIVTLQVQVDRLTDVLAGATPFTGLNVGGTNVKPFLDRTDGAALTVAAGLGDSVVTTPAVLAGSVTPYYAAFTAGTVNWAASSAEKDAQTVNGVVVTRGVVLIDALVSTTFGTVGAGQTGQLRLYRDGVEIFLAAVQLQEQGGYLPKQYVLRWIDTPGAGTFDYKATFEPGGVSTGDIFRRALTVLPLEG